MKSRPETLLLGKTYEFEVTVHFNDDYFAGKIFLDKNKINLIVMGEHYDGRARPPSWNEKNMACSNLWSSFLLINLKPRKQQIRSIPSPEHKRSFFEVHYEAEYIIFSEGKLNLNTNFTSIEISSTTINNWLGNTNKQEEILRESHKNPMLENISTLEFSVNINGHESIGIEYCPVHEYNSLQYRTQFYCPPKFYSIFQASKNVCETITFYNNLLNLFTFITGDECEIDEIKLFTHSSSFVHNVKASLYYPINKYPQRQERTIVLFPRNKNIRFPYQDIHELPDKIFNEYFNNNVYHDTTTIWFLTHYNTYRRRKAVEERFLGYYRLLEKLCFIESSYADPDTLENLLNRSKKLLKKVLSINGRNLDGFINQIKLANKRKYNSEKQILEFYKKIPHNCTQTWCIKTEDIKTISKLRNDITHANQHDIDINTQEKFTKFIEVLLIFGVAEKLGISYEYIEKTIPNLNGYHLIRKTNE